LALVMMLTSATEVVLVVQIVHVIRTGDTWPFFASKSPRHRSGRASGRALTGAVLLLGAAAAGILVILATTLAKDGVSPLLAWLATRPGDAIGGNAVFWLGFSGVLWPGYYLKGVQDAYPNADVNLVDSEYARFLTRALGGLMLVLGLSLVT
jgi:hypothetical protein